MYSLILVFASWIFFLAWYICSYFCSCITKVLKISSLVSSDFPIWILHLLFLHAHLSVYDVGFESYVIFLFSFFLFLKYLQLMLAQLTNKVVMFIIVRSLNSKITFGCYGLFKLFKIFMLSSSLSKVFPRARMLEYLL